MQGRDHPGQPVTQDLGLASRIQEHMKNLGISECKTKPENWLSTSETDIETDILAVKKKLKTEENHATQFLYFNVLDVNK